MVLMANIAKSKKRIGRYEEKIIQSLAEYFRYEGYEVVSHSRLNVAWGSILSDIDLLLLKDGLLTYVEVKSCRDNIARATEQVECVKDYIDYAYVATERKVRNWNVPKVGLIHIQEDIITFVKAAKKFQNKPRFLSILTLKKKCLAKFFEADINYLTHVDKYDLAQTVYATKANSCTRECLKEITTCGESCNMPCPISEIVR